MDLVDPGHVIEQMRRARLKQQDVARPLGHNQHVPARRIGDRVGNAGHADDQLQVEEQQDENIRLLAGFTDARVEQAPVNEKRHADQADEGEDSASNHRQQLFAFHGEAKGRVDLGRGEQAEEMPAEKEQDADMEEDAAPIELLSAQKLA